MSAAARIVVAVREDFNGAAAVFSMECAQGDDLPGFGDEMALLAALFAEAAGAPPPEQVDSASELVDILRETMPRGQPSGEEPPTLEAAAFTGEWVRSRVGGVWMAAEPGEPCLQVTEPGGAIVYLLPLPALLRRAVSAGYDGMVELLEHVLGDVMDPPHEGGLDELRAEGEVERIALVAWLRRHRDLSDKVQAALWRRCGQCSRMHVDEVDFQPGDLNVETSASNAADLLAMRVFRCPCGGIPDPSRRFLLLHAAGSLTRFADIGISETHTRIGCWTLREGRATPCDASVLAGSAG